MLYLYDPETEWGKSHNPDLVELEKIADVPCLVLLGEPGIGKSKIIEKEHERISDTYGETPLVLNLHAYGSEDRLIKKLFESQQFRNWVQGNHRLHIFLDSLDECLLWIDNVTNLLAEEFKQYQDKTDRLFLRVVCRTAVWQSTFEEQLRQIWGKDQVKIYELAPLRWRDVRHAAEREEIADPDIFLQEIWNKNLIPLAIKPITLRFLIRIYRSDSQFSENQTLCDLYLKGCRILCDEEDDADPRRPGHKENLDLDERLIIAARIAAVTVFANRDAIWMGRESGQIPDDDVLRRELAQGYESINEKPVEVKEAAITEVLGTGLFSSSGENRIGWAHQTYAEFLAAWYLKQRKIELGQILSLIIHPDQRVVPQLQETAAWLASLMPEVFQEVLKTDPDILLQSDIENQSNENKETLVTSLLKLYNEGKIIRNYNFGRYKKLQHLTLWKQLRPYICGHIGNDEAQRVAIDIAEACNVNELQEDLADVALNPQQPYWTRVSAAIAVCKVGDTNTKSNLMPLALSQAGDDPEDELKGCGLRAIWPDHIFITKLLNLLTKPQSKVIGGRYQSFIAHDVSKHLQIKDLPAALDWVGRQPRRRELRYPFQQLSDQILLKAWENFDRLEVSEKFIECAIYRLKQYEEVFDLSDQESFYFMVKANDNKRLKFIRKLISSSLISETDLSWLTRNRLNKTIILQDDILWMLDQLESSSDEKIQKIWSELIYSKVKWLDSEHISKILIVSERNSILKNKFIELIEPIEIGSEKAKKSISSYLEDHKMEEESRLVLLEPPPQQRVLDCLKRFESEDYTAWTILCFEMKLTPTSTSYRNDWRSDLTSLPGWLDAGTNTQNRIIKAAQSYILFGDPNSQEWLGTNEISCSALSGYQVLYLNAIQNNGFIEHLKPEIWRKWASSILCFPLYSDDKYENSRKVLIQQAYIQAPQETIQAFNTKIAQQNEQGWIDIHRQLEFCWDEHLSINLLNLIQDLDLNPQNLETLLEIPLKNRSAEVQSYAKSLVTLPLFQNVIERDKSIAAARSLLLYAEDAGWSVVRSLIQAEPELSRKIIESAFYAFEHNQLGQRLDENDCAELYIFLVRHYFELKESKSNSLRKYHNSYILQRLQERGTPEACEAFRKIIRELPQLADELQWRLLETEAAARRTTWNPPLPKDILQLVFDQNKRLVQDGHQLLGVLIESLNRLELELQGETSAVRDLWNEWKGNLFRPNDENAFSDYVKRFLDRDLKSRGIIINREVELRRSYGGNPGERTDIHVDAVLKRSNSEVYETITVIIEVKGCWHSEVETAMESQLVGRYLADNACKYGLYLIGWFDCQQWDGQDSRKNKTPKMAIDEAKTQFDRQAETLSSSGNVIRAYVMNTALR